MANQIREFCYSYDKKISVITIIILKSVLKGDVKQILAIWPPNWVKQKIVSKTLKEGTWFAQLQTNKFQGLFKDKLQFSRTKIYSINRPSLTPFWTPYWLKHVMESVICNFYFFSHGWSHYFILLSTTKLWKMTGYDLQLHLRYRNSI